MSPYILILLICVIIAITVAIIKISSKVENIKKLRIHQENLKTGKEICVHTFEDCQTCMASNGCVQRLGKGLLSNRRE